MKTLETGTSRIIAPPPLLYLAAMLIGSLLHVITSATLYPNDYFLSMLGALVFVVSAVFALGVSHNENSRYIRQSIREFTKPDNYRPIQILAKSDLCGNDRSLYRFCITHQRNLAVDHVDPPSGYYAMGCYIPRRAIPQ